MAVLAPDLIPAGPDALVRFASRPGWMPTVPDEPGSAFRRHAVPGDAGNDGAGRRAPGNRRDGNQGAPDRGAGSYGVGHQEAAQHGAGNHGAASHGTGNHGTGNLGDGNHRAGQDSGRDHGSQAARPQLLRALNEQLLLGQIRALGSCSRADLARMSGLSKATVSMALANVERAGLVRLAGQRTGLPGRSALLYEIRPEAGYVLGLDIGMHYLRGALADLTGRVQARSSARARATSAAGRVAELVGLADALCDEAGVTRAAVTQTVIGSPGVYDPVRDSMVLTGGLGGWGSPKALAGLRAAFGQQLVVENDIDAAALAEREHGHGREFASFAFVSIGTGIGMGLVLGGRLHRGVHGVAGEIAFMPISDGQGSDAGDARRRGTLEAAGSASAVVRAARRAGMRGPVSARRVFAAAAAGDERAAAVVADEALLVAKAICAVITVVDPQLVVLGGGIGQAPGFAAAVTTRLARLAPVLPEVRVSALGTEAVVDGCLASGADLAWKRLTAAMPDGQQQDGSRREPLAARSS